jgi:signal transduction histidine kinase
MLKKSAMKRERILVVDDLPDNLTIAQTILEDEGYEVSLVTDGQTALEEIAHSPPDLLLLDVMMPEMDGYEVTRRLRQDRRLPFIPILLISANDQSSVVEGLDAGADDFIRKPVDVEELLARVRSLLRLKHSIDERDRTARLREDFVARLTHDLRIPLVAANRILKLMREGRYCEVSPEMGEMLDNTIVSNNDLLQMVNALLEVYRHEASSKTLDFSECDLSQLATEIVQELTLLAEEKELTLTLELAAPHITVMGDPVELRRVLVNLVGNAIKFTDRGSIVVRLASGQESRIDRDGSSPAVPAAILEVEDTGPGISATDQKTLFERFHSGTNPSSGTGLGLYLSSLIVKAHQGTIKVISELGQGSLFRVSLPVRQGHRA